MPGTERRWLSRREAKQFNGHTVNTVLSPMLRLKAGHSIERENSTTGTSGMVDFTASNPENWAPGGPSALASDFYFSVNCLGAFRRSESCSSREHQ
jgi:hypothetical protein